MRALLAPLTRAQDPKTGLPLHRQEKLLQVFKVIDNVRARDGSSSSSAGVLPAHVLACCLPCTCGVRCCC